MESTRKIFSGEYKLIHQGIQTMINKQEEEFSRIKSMIENPEYIYMTEEVSWRYLEPVKNNIDALYRLQDKLTAKKKTFFISE